MGIEWYKSPFVKGMIKNATFKTFSEVMEQYVEVIEGHGKKKSKMPVVARKTEVAQQKPIASSLKTERNVNILIGLVIFLFGLFVGSILFQSKAKESTFEPFEFAPQLKYSKFESFFNLTLTMEEKRNQFELRLDELEEMREKAQIIMDALVFLENPRPPKNSIEKLQDFIQKLQ